MRGLILIAALTALVGCGQAPLEAEAERYRFLKQTYAPAGERCAQAERALAAAIDAQNEPWARQWRFTRDEDCKEAAGLG